MIDSLAGRDRQDWLRKRLSSAGRVEVGNAAEELGVSLMTVRRDLRELEDLGWARRVRGGAVLVGPARFSERHSRHAHAKAAIAAKLLRLVPEHGAVALDGSSTVLRLATSLAPVVDLVVITNGIETFAALQGRAGVQAMLTGGWQEPRTSSLVGPLAVQAVQRLALSHVFMSAAAVDPQLGPSESSVEEAELKSALAGQSDQVILAVDSSKLNRRAIAPSISWGAVTLLVTELDPMDARLGPYCDLVKVA